VVGGQNFLVSRPHEGRTGTDQPGTASTEQSLDQSSIGVSRSRAAAAVGATTRMNSGTQSGQRSSKLNMTPALV
jgi:hypothetical protein